MPSTPREIITIYGLMFGRPLDCTLGEVNQQFRERATDELIAEAGFGVTVGTAFDRAYSSDDPRTIAIGGTVFGPVALELDRRGIPFPINEDDRLAAFEMWKRIMRSGDDYAVKIPAHRLAAIQESFREAMQRIGPWGQPVIIGSLLQSLMVVESLLGHDISDNQVKTNLYVASEGDEDEKSSDGEHAVSLFIAYAHKDSKYREAFVSHLSPLRRQGKISEWYDRKIVPGHDWNREIDEHLEQADLIIPLISADFISSDYAYGIELQRALEKHNEGAAAVVPVIVKPVHWRGQPFAELQMLPTDAKAITEWRLQDNAWVTVVKGIERAISSLGK